MVSFEMSLPPCEELLNIPTNLINEGNLFGSQIKAVCGNPDLQVSAEKICGKMKLHGIIF